MIRAAASTGLRSLPARRIGSTLLPSTAHATSTRWTAAAHESLSTLHLPAHVWTDESDDGGKEAEGRRRIHVQSMTASSPWTETTAQRQRNRNRHHHLQSVRSYRATAPVDRGVAIVLGLGAVAATAKAGQYAVRAYDQWKIESAKAAEEEAKARAEAGIGDGDAEDGASQEEAKKAAEDGKKANKGGEKRENFFAKFFDMSVGSKYYEGGFEDKMTRREAALILGVRESSTPKRIKEAHRKLLVLNHPDTGGSTFVAGKINEAKELLLKGRKA